MDSQSSRFYLINLKTYRWICFPFSHNEKKRFYFFIETLSTSLSCEIIDERISFEQDSQISLIFDEGLFSKQQGKKCVCVGVCVCLQIYQWVTLLFSNFCWNFNYFLLGFAWNFYCSFVNRVICARYIVSQLLFSFQFFFRFFFSTFYFVYFPK